MNSDTAATETPADQLPNDTVEGIDAVAAEKKSIIPAKYADAYKDRTPDWVGDKIAENCVTVTKNDKGKETSSLDVDRLLTLAQENGIDTTEYEKQVDRPNAPGRLRMTIGNMLRARVKRRHGLFNCNSKWSNAPAEFLESISAPGKPTEKRDGEKIVQPKPAKAETTETPVEAEDATG